MKIESITDDALLIATRELVNRTNAVAVELLIHLGEIDARQLYLGRAFPSMFAFCTEELGFSEDVAYQRIGVARLARRLPRVLDALRLGQVHLAGLRVLAPHLNEDNVDTLLLEARGKSKRDIEEIAARLAPKPPVASMIRKVPTTATPSLLDLKPAVLTLHTLASAPAPVASPVTPAPARRPVVKPLSEDTFRVQLTAKRPLREELKEAQALMRHAVPDGDLAEILERALDLLIAQKKKERFGVGRKPRAKVETSATNVSATTDAPAAPTPSAATRHIPDAVKRMVYERDGGQCTFLADDGRRCAQTSALEARTVTERGRQRCDESSGVACACACFVGRF